MFGRWLSTGLKIFIYLQCSEYSLISSAKLSICCFMYSQMLTEAKRVSIARGMMSGGPGSYILGQSTDLSNN